MDNPTKGLAGLQYRRKAAGLTQDELAQSLGVARSAISMWEIGSAWPSAAILPKLADLLLCSIEELYFAPAPEEASV